MSGSNQRRRRASGVLAEAIRKDLERDANAGAESDAHRRRERRNSAAFRRASFQAANAVGPAPPAGVKKLGKMAKDDDEMERQQQGPSAWRRSSTTGNLVRRGSGSNVARRGSNGSSAPKGGTYPRRTSISKRRSPVDDKKQAAKSSSPTTRHPQRPSDETDEDDEEEGGDDDALIMACIANVESRSKPGYRPSPPTVSESSKSKQSTIASTKAGRGKQGTLDAFLEGQKQERAALAYFQTQQAEASALLRATQNGADKVKKNRPQSSLTSTNTVPREEKPISSELARHQARVKAAQEREDSVYTGMNLEEHKARIASRYGGDASAIKKSVKLKKASSSSSSPSPTVKPKKTSSSSSSSSPKGEAGKEERKASSRSRKSKEATMPSKQPEKKKRELQQKRGSLHKLKDLPSVSSPSSQSKCAESVSSSSSRKNAILAASRRIRTQGYDDLSESHRSLTSTGNRSRESVKRGEEDERYVDQNMRNGKKANRKARNEQVQAEGDAGTSSNLICDFGERRRDSGRSITEEDKRLVGSKAA